MFVPSIVADINDIVFDSLNWTSILPSRTSPILVVIALITPELVFEVNRGPKERVIK